MDLIRQIIADLEGALIRERIVREKLGGLALSKTVLRIVGQISLLMDPDVTKLLPLASTFDFDALIIPPSEPVKVRELLKEVLRKFNFEYDDLSSEVWLPPDAKFIEYHDSYDLRVERIDPISALTSKAVKAPDKNRELIAYALNAYGDSLRSNIIKYDGKPELFQGRQRLKL